MKRRRILQGLALGCTGASTPVLLSRFFGVEYGEPEICGSLHSDSNSDSRPEPQSNGTPTTPHRSIDHCASSRPNLYLVVPDNIIARRARGQALGEFLNYGTDSALARLAVFKVTCVTIKELQAITGETIDGDPWFVLLDSSSRYPQTIALDDSKLSRIADERSAEDSIIDERIRRIGDLIATAIQPDMLDRMIKSESAALPKHLETEFAAVMNGPLSPRLELVEAAPATFLQPVLAHPDPDSDTRWYTEEQERVFTPRLAALTREHLVHSTPPTGAHWARSGGCGTRVEGLPERIGFSCGMGHVPERSRRFLTFLSDSERF